jgi:lactate dehydrogenase-like 2-hydroxyacid dehydrogenase
LNTISQSINLIFVLCKEELAIKPNLIFQILNMPSFEVDPKRHTIVELESALVGLHQELVLPESTYEIISYPHTAPKDIAARINNATIIVAVTLKFDAHLLSKEVSPKLQLIDYVASGTDGMDKQACKERGILVCNASGASAAAVSEHALGLYFALRRHIFPTHEAVQRGNWTERSVLNAMMRDPVGELPLSCKQEVMGIIGQGVIGESAKSR